MNGIHIPLRDFHLAASCSRKAFPIWARKASSSKTGSTPRKFGLGFLWYITLEPRSLSPINSSLHQGEMDTFLRLVSLLKHLSHMGFYRFAAAIGKKAIGRGNFFIAGEDEFLIHIRRNPHSFLGIHKTPDILRLNGRFPTHPSRKLRGEAPGSPGPRLRRWWWEGSGVFSSSIL